MKTYLPVFAIVIALLSACSKSTTSYVNNPNAPEYLHNRPVGSSANELLASTKYTSLKIEVQYMTGYTPDAAALNHLQTVLAGLVNKPAGINVVTKEIPASVNLTLSINDITNIEKNNRTVFTSGNELGVYILYTNGNYTDASTLGVAYRNTSVALFGKKIQDNSGGLGQASRTKLVATVAEHELGHLLGLVDLGSTMQTNHKDAAHGNHCSNTNCLMYYASETTDILGFLVTGNIPSFDANCRADLHANGGQ
ncbi:MAG TPA: M12 family metallo-peptidase [Chitinophagaceae bacterium]